MSILAIATGAVGLVTAYPWATDRFIPASRVVGAESAVFLAKACAVVSLLLVLSVLLRSDCRRLDVLRMPWVSRRSRPQVLLHQLDLIEDVLSDPAAARASLPFRWSGPDGDGLVAVRNGAIRILEQRGIVSHASAEAAVQRLLLRAGRPLDPVGDAFDEEDSRWRRWRETQGS